MSAPRGNAARRGADRLSSRQGGWQMRGVRLHTGMVAAVSATFFVFALAGGAGAFQQLPPGERVNNDLGPGINPAFPVGAEEPTNADVVGGSLVTTKPAVPWAIFQQGENAFDDQIFVRSFAGASWTTRGNGTVGGLSDGSPNFPASLNFDRTENAEAPAIDFAGLERTVPWATWYEESSSFFGPEIFASKFDAGQNKWVFAGQGRGKGGGTVPVPSLNIDPEPEAENPSVAGGSLTEPKKPGPWITWQENQLYTELIEIEPGEIEEEELEHHQIYVVRPESPNEEGSGKDRAV